MPRFSVSTALSLAAGVIAQNVAPPVPLDAQIGLLNFPVTCKVYGILNQTFNAVFSATAPVYGGVGEQVYFTDVVGHITIPHSIVGLAGIITAKQASANVSVYVGVSNASPSTLLAYEHEIDNITLPSSGDAVIRIPPGNGTLPPIGPVALTAGTGASRITLGAVSVNVTLQSASGNKVFGPIPVTCGKQDVDFIIGSINTNGKGGKALSPAVGYVPAFPETDYLYQSGSFRFPYQCSFGSFGTQNLDLIIGGTIATYFAPGQQFDLTNAQAFLHVPPALLKSAKAKYPTLANFHTTVNSFNILFTNANPASYDVASSNSIVTDTSVGSNVQDIVIPIPSNGAFTIGPITAGSAGTIAGVSVGTASAQIALQDKNGKNLYSFPVSCKVPAALELIGVPITNSKPGNYSIIPSLGAKSSTTSSTAAATSTKSGIF